MSTNKKTTRGVSLSKRTGNGKRKQPEREKEVDPMEQVPTDHEQDEGQGQEKNQEQEMPVAKRSRFAAASLLEAPPSTAVADPVETEEAPMAIEDEEEEEPEIPFDENEDPSVDSCDRYEGSDWLNHLYVKRRKGQDPTNYTWDIAMFTDEEHQKLTDLRFHLDLRQINKPPKAWPGSENDPSASLSVSFAIRGAFQPDHPDQRFYQRLTEFEGWLKNFFRSLPDEEKLEIFGQEVADQLNDEGLWYASTQFFRSPLNTFMGGIYFRTRFQNDFDGKQDYVLIDMTGSQRYSIPASAVKAKQGLAGTVSIGSFNVRKTVKKTEIDGAETEIGNIQVGYAHRVHCMARYSEEQLKVMDLARVPQRKTNLEKWTKAPRQLKGFALPPQVKPAPAKKAFDAVNARPGFAVPLATKGSPIRAATVNKEKGV